MNVKNGIEYYTKGTISMPIYFPNDETDCAHCQYCFEPKDDELHRHRCTLTDETLFYVYNSRGRECPIKFKEVQS